MPQHIRRLKTAILRDWGILAIAASIVVLTCFVGAVFFLRGKLVMEQQIRSELTNMAAIAATRFDWRDVEQIHNQSDMRKPAFIRLVSKLNAIRSSVPDVRFAYIMRRTNDPRILSFVADADALSTTAELDVNHNGNVDSDEAPSMPGDVYDTANFPLMATQAFLHPTADRQAASDQWGSFISGYAPIMNDKGQAVAIVGLDMDSREFATFSQSIFPPLIVLLVLFAGITSAAGVFLFIWRRRYETLKRMELERTGLLRLTFHQLGEPITIMKWALEILEDRNATNMHDTIVSEQISSIGEGLGRLSMILNTLRIADEVRQGTVRYQPELHDLGEIVTAIEREMNARLQRRHQQLSISLDCNRKVPIDRRMIMSVLRQLVDNAMSYSPESTAIQLRARCDMHQVSVEIQDAGYGIPKSDQPHLFEEFMRGSTAPNYQPDGNGLGLYIVRGIVEAAGGKIELDSTEGKGTTVSFSLPIKS